MEQRYDATKRECRGVLKALKKTRHWLYVVHFVLETDANVLVAQLNGACTDLPGALIIRWIAWIRLFDFEVKHVAGRNIRQQMDCLDDLILRKKFGPNSRSKT